MGIEISNIQSRLNHLGFDCGTVDGIFGGSTTKSVKAFQTAASLEPTGIVDAVTYRALIGREAPTVSRSASHLAARRIVQSAMSYVGVPYRYGGNTPRGFDCSGFTKFVYGQAGINLPRMADAQFMTGEPVKHPNLQTGDLVFFTTYAPGASHVGIYLDNGLFISATSSGGIRVTSLHDTYYWGQRYIGARRVL
jgi:cell wall-associated NlpC family hydrolase